MTPKTATVVVKLTDLDEVKALADRAGELVKFAEWCVDPCDDEGIPPTYEEINVRAEVALGRRDPDDMYGWEPL